MSEQVVLVDRPAAGVARVTMHRPHRRNALIGDSFLQLEEAFHTIRRDQDVRAVIFTGTGDDFCTGSDLDANANLQGHLSHRTRLVADVVLGLHLLPQPTIAAVRGRAYGAGCNLALGCDLVVAADDARFAQMFPLRGLSPDAGGTWLLPRLIGIHRAKAMALRGAPVEATEAERWGLVNELVPADKVDETALSIATELAERAPVAMALTKQLLNNSSSLTFQQALEAEANAALINTSTPETQAALSGFRDRPKGNRETGPTGR
jgi:2-(1,2-epoxy-1,2-dihydrophenyl)acetyl-CoA isomerase